MLTYEHLKPGTKIRAWEFMPATDRKDRYVEGVIAVATTCPITGVKFFRVRVDLDTLYPNRPREWVHVPMETDGDEDWAEIIATHGRIQNLTGEV